MAFLTRLPGGERRVRQTPSLGALLHLKGSSSLAACPVGRPAAARGGGHMLRDSRRGGHIGAGGAGATQQLQHAHTCTN